MNPIIIGLGLVFLATLSPAIPQSATIVPVLPEQQAGANPIGNVKVVFTDGHHEMWTKLGRACLPKCAASGLVGWVTYTGRNDRGWPVTNTLRVCWPPDGRHKDFKAESKPFIQDWGFADNDTSVVIRSTGSHGPSEYEKYSLVTGAFLGDVDGSEQALPDWAQPYSADEPLKVAP